MSTRIRRGKKSSRGTSLIEATIAMGTLLFGLTGLLSMQVVVARTNTFSRKVRQASALAADLVENVQRWDYSDARLTSGAVISDTADTRFTNSWNMGRNKLASTQAGYGEQASDPNAVVANALTTGAGRFQGLNPDVDGDGEADFQRYWNVYDLNLNGTPEPNGKLVQVIVRWKEPVLGYRQVTSTAFIVNPAAVMQ